MPIEPHLIWFLLGLVLILLEFAVPGVILVFFGIGAWCVSFLSYIGVTPSMGVQVLTFGVTSILLLVLLRKQVKGKFYGHVSAEQDMTRNLDEFTGKSVLVLEDIPAGSKPGGAVEFKGARWSAVSDEAISKDETAVIIQLSGLTFTVKRKEEGA